MIWILFLWVGFMLATRGFLIYILFLGFPPIVVGTILCILFIDAVNFVAEYMKD